MYFELIMRLFVFFSMFVLFIEPFTGFGQVNSSNNKKLKMPPRIIRTCCAFGSNVGIIGVPFLKYTETTSIEKLGDHVYMGGKDEGNGIVYTCKGGFIDVGHLREQSDWTAFLYGVITSNKGNSINIKLGREGGVKRLELNIPESLSNSDAILLAGRITYDLSVWHEISTWYGVSSIPFIPERYSAFSIEDDYSNLLGVTLGMKALRSDMPFEKAMTKILRETLDSLQVVENEEETLQAMEDVRNDWWTREKKLPSRKIIMKRDISDYKGASPLLIPNRSKKYLPANLELQNSTANNEPLTNFYSLDFRLNRKFPMRELFPERNGRRISEDDFLIILDNVKEDINQKQEADNYREQRKLSRKANKG